MMELHDIAAQALSFLHDNALVHLAQAQDPVATPVPLAPVDTGTVGNQTVYSDDFSVYSLFMRADIIVKAVLAVLLFASFWSWAIIVDKSLKLSALNRKANRFETIFWSGKSLDDLSHSLTAKPDHPLAVVFSAAMNEWRRSLQGGALGHAQLGSIKDRIDRVMNVTIARELGTVERNLGFLATVGSTAPFVGLFGTVWGIMNSFRAIASSHDTNLAVVAPGIAEALFATALGLLAAIPAVVAYNNLSTKLSRYSARVEGFADEFSAILSRQLDERAR